MKVLRLPEELRGELKPPLGVLYKGKGPECITPMHEDIMSAPKVIAVGDITTFCMLSSSPKRPDLCILDNQTKRAPAPDHVLEGICKNDCDYDIVEVNNPAATLTQELIEVIRDVLASERKVKVVVKGEEDLATLPAIFYAPLGSVVVYGQPNEGSVMVKVTSERKEHAKSIMDRMIVED